MPEGKAGSCHFRAKGGFCRSCGGSRMSDAATHLADRDFPELPVRHWVLSLRFAREQFFEFMNRAYEEHSPVLHG